jgi:hypothetical protein
MTNPILLLNNSAIGNEAILAPLIIQETFLYKKNNLAIKKTVHRMKETKQKVGQNGLMKYKHIHRQRTIPTEELA